MKTRMVILEVTNKERARQYFRIPGGTGALRGEERVNGPFPICGNWCEESYYFYNGRARFDEMPDRCVEELKTIVQAGCIESSGTFGLRVRYEYELSDSEREMIISELERRGLWEDEQEKAQ